MRIKNMFTTPLHYLSRTIMGMLDELDIIYCNFILNPKACVKTLCISNNYGDGYLDVVMKILIAVVIGAAMLALLKTAMPTLFESVINKVKDVIANSTT